MPILRLVFSSYIILILLLLSAILYFFNWLFIVALTARSYRDCYWFSVFRMVLYWYFEPQQFQMRFFLIHGRHLSGRVQCSHRGTTAMWTTMSSGNHIYHERHLSCRVQCSHRTSTDDINHETRQPLYELLYGFKLHCHLLGNLSHHFDNNCFISRETVNMKYYINNSGIWGATRHLPLKNN